MNGYMAYKEKTRAAKEVDSSSRKMVRNQDPMKRQESEITRVYKIANHKKITNVRP